MGVWFLMHFSLQRAIPAFERHGMLTVKGVPRAFLACGRVRGGFGRAQSSWGRSQPLLGLCCGIEGSLVNPPVPRLPLLPPQLTAEGAGLKREQTRPEMLLVTLPLPRFSLRHLCAVLLGLLGLLAPPLPSSCMLGPSLLDFSCSKMEAQRKSPWPGACPCLKSPWGKERKCLQAMKAALQPTKFSSM